VPKALPAHVQASGYIGLRNITMLQSTNKQKAIKQFFENKRDVSNIFSYSFLQFPREQFFFRNRF
jgi:hypothetical protein